MKISKMSTDKGLDVLCELTPLINGILTDEELKAELQKEIKADEVKSYAQLIQIGVEKLNVVVPILLKKRRADVLGILAILNEKPAEEIAKQNVLTTAAQLKDIIKDKDLIDFFKSCTDAEGGE